MSVSELESVSRYFLVMSYGDCSHVSYSQLVLDLALPVLSLVLPTFSFAALIHLSAFLSHYLHLQSHLHFQSLGDPYMVFC